MTWTPIYTLQELEESIEDSKLKLGKINRGLLSLEDSGDLEDRVITLERLLRTLKTDVKRLRGSQEEKPTPLANRAIESQAHSLVLWHT